MYPSVRKPKSSNTLSQRKNFVKSVRKQYGNPDSHYFLITFNFFLITCLLFKKINFDKNAFKV